MKNDVMPSIVQMDADELKTLLTETKETVATGFELNRVSNRSFSVADMWNIRRKAKSSSAMLKR
jgi:hypothetical protein